VPGDDESIKESDTLHKIGVDCLSVTEMKVRGSKRHDETLADIKALQLQYLKLLGEHRYVIDQLRAMNFDIALMTYFPVEALIVKAIKIPYLWYYQHLMAFSLRAL
jgi:hypothetical protein